MKISKIEGIGSAYGSRLNSQGIKTIGHLLAAAASRKGRRALAEQTGLSENLILEWANRADLMRINGVGEEYSDLLEAAGVDTVRELAYRRPENLLQSMIEVNKEKHLVRRAPSLAQIQHWVEQAKTLPTLISY